MASHMNEKNLFRSRAEYNAAVEMVGGVDFTSPDGRCEAGRFPYMVNMYRDWEREDGTALETIPGYRFLPKHLGEDEARIYGLFSHTFSLNGESVPYLIVHKGTGLYRFRHDTRDNEETLLPVATVAAAPSCGYSRDGAFYFLDGENFLCLPTPETVVRPGDETYTEDALDSGQFPSTTAYIPTVYQNGEAHEDFNLLTSYYDVEDSPARWEEVSGDYGLKLRPVTDSEEEALEVYGLEGGRRAVYVPDSAVYNGKTLPIIRIAPGAFSGRGITLAVLSPSVKSIGGNEGVGDGAFYGCSSLKRVLLGGVETLEADAFALCSSLETLILPATLKTVAPSAFYGTSTLKTVYYEGASFPDEWAIFPSSVTQIASVTLLRARVGETLRFACNPAIHPRGIGTVGNAAVLSSFEEYDGVYDAQTALETGYTAKALSRTALVGFHFPSTTSGEASRYFFCTVTDEAGCVFSSEEEPLALFRLPLPVGARAVVSVTLDGQALALSPSDDETTEHYRIETTLRQGVSAITALYLTLPYAARANRVLRARLFGCVGDLGASEYTDYRTLCPTYTGTSQAVLSGCTLAAQYDGRVFLSGNPALPGLVFYSLTPQSNGQGLYFGVHAVVNCPEGGRHVTALLAHPAFLAVMKEETDGAGGLFFCTPEDGAGILKTIYRVERGTGAVGCAGACLHFLDDPVFLSRYGLEAIDSANRTEVRGVESRSYAIDRRLNAFDNRKEAVLCEWKGYLVLLYHGEIYLGDSRAVYTRNGAKQYEWYYLSDIGHYVGQRPLYRTMSVSPVVNGIRLDTLWVDGLPLEVQKEEAVITGEVKEAVAETAEGSASGITVYYTDLFDEKGVCHRCLADTEGEKIGGVFSPAVALCSWNGLLYFGTADGALFCFNTDKRGEAPVINGKTMAVAEDEIHAFWYTFNGRAIESGFVTKSEDHGAPHLAKSTVRRSLTLRSRRMPYSAFTVAVKTEKGPFRKLMRVTASGALDETDYTNASLAPEARPLYLLAEHEKKWVEKQFAFFSAGFRRPFAIYSLAYRYRMAGRARL